MRRSRLTAALTALALPWLAPALVADDSTEDVRVVWTDEAEGGAEAVVTTDKKVFVHRVSGDEGDHQMVFIDADGEPRTVLGSDVVWHGEDGGFDFAFGPRTFLGLQLAPMTPELRAHFGVPEDAGVLVSKVVSDSPAARAGLQVGDVVTSLEGKAVGSPGALRHAVMARHAGETVLLEAWRDGRVMNISATLEAHEPETQVRRLHLNRSCEGHEACRPDHPHAMMIGSLCEGLEACKVKVQCEDDGCSCQVNDTDVDCPEHLRR